MKSYWEGKEGVWHLPNFFRPFSYFKKHVCYIEVVEMVQMPKLQSFLPLKKPGGQESISFSSDPDISSCVFNPRGEKEREREKHLA